MTSVIIMTIIMIILLLLTIIITIIINRSVSLYTGDLYYLKDSFPTAQVSKN